MNAAQAVGILNNYLDDDGPPDDPSMGKAMSPEEFKRRFGGASGTAEIGMAPPMNITAPIDDDVVAMGNRSPLPSNHPQWDMETGWDKPGMGAAKPGAGTGVVVMNNPPSSGQMIVGDDPWGQAMPHNRNAIGINTPANVSDVLGSPGMGGNSAVATAYNPQAHPMGGAVGYEVTERVASTPTGTVHEQTTRRLPGEGRGREQYQVVREATPIPSHTMSPANPMPEGLVTRQVVAQPKGMMGGIPKSVGMVGGIAGALGAAALLNNFFQGRKAEEERKAAAIALSNDPNLIV